MIICSYSSSNCTIVSVHVGGVVVVTNNLIILCIPQRVKHISGMKWLSNAIGQVTYYCALNISIE